MKKLSFEALKSQATVSSEVMEKITGGSKSHCHCVPAGSSESGGEVWICCD